MLSGIGPGAHLREMGIDVAVDSSGVGQNLQDHPVSGILSYTKDTSDVAEMLGLGNLLRWRATGKGPMSSNVAETGAFYASRDDLEHPDIQLHVAPTGFYDNGMHEPVRRALTTAVTLVNVQSKGHVKLRSADPTWHPEIDPGYFDDQADLDAMIGGFRRALDVLRQGPVARFIDEPWIPSLARSHRRRDHRRHRQARPDALPPRRDLRDGHDRGQRRRSGASGPRRRGPTGRRRLGHASRPPRQHQRPHHHDRREVRRPHQGVTMTATIDNPAATGAPAETFDSLNPANGDLVGTYPVATKADVDAAVARARDAADWWGNLTFAERGEYLLTWRSVITRRIAQLADLSHRETGKPHGDAQLEIILAIDHIAWAAKHAKKVLGSSKVKSGLLMVNQAATVEYKPLGVVGRHRPVELPGLHAGRLDRLRAGGRQHRRVQAQRVHAGRGSVAGRHLRRGRARA